MSDFRTTPKITRSRTLHLLAASLTAVSLNMSHAPLGVAAVNSAAAHPLAADSATSLRLTERAFVHPAIGLDHGVIAVDAVSVGDDETVGMSIGAYDRTPQPAPSR